MILIRISPQILASKSSSHHVPGAALLLFVDEEGNWEDNWVVTPDGGGGY